MCEGEDVLLHTARGINDVLRDLHGVIPAHHGIGHADAATDSGADVGDDRIRAILRHLDRLFRRGHIDDAEQVHSGGQAHHLKLLVHAHAGFFQHAAEVTIDNGVSREIIHAGEAHLLHAA